MGQKKLFLEKFAKLKPLQEVIKYKEGLKQNFTKNFFILCEGNRLDYYSFCGYLRTIEQRFGLAHYCLQKIIPDCKNKEVYPCDSGKHSFKEDNPISPDIMIYIEYFVFAIKSCLDIMAHIFNLTYEFDYREKDVNISKICNEMVNLTNDSFAIFLVQIYDEWIKEFNKIRVKMTHYQILPINTSISHNFVENKSKFTKRMISIKNKGKAIEKELPTYFEETIKNMEKLFEEFYKKLNSLNFEGQAEVI